MSHEADTDGLSQAAKLARAEVRRRAVLSAGATLVPLPGLDIAVDLGALVSMFNTINRIFYLSPEQMAQLNTEDRIALFKAMSHVGSMFAGKYVSSAMVLGLVKQVGARWENGRVARWVPVIGQGTAAALSYGMFTWLGESHIKECLAIRREAKLLMLTHTKEEA